jgi:hypothetical protein
MPVYVRATDSVTWHWCFNCSGYPWNALRTGGLFLSDRPRCNLCKKCLRMERRGTCSN